MARPREFDAVEALQTAMETFWLHGSRCSIDELVGATGVSRAGLYAEFGSKDGLFLRALEQYRRQVTEARLAGMFRPEANLDDIDAFFTGLRPMLRTPAAQRGCLLVNTMLEGRVDADVVVQTYLGRVRQAFRACIGRAVETGAAAADVDADLVADQFTLSLIGLMALARSGAEFSALGRAINAISALVESLRLPTSVPVASKPSRPSKTTEPTKRTQPTRPNPKH